MRPLVLLLLVVPAILHAYPQQLDRRHTEAVEANASSRGSRKYSPKDEQPTVESPGAWHPERTQRRQSSKQLPQQSAPSYQSTAVKSRTRTSSRRADTHIPEPESASSVLTQVTQQLISPRRTYHERHFATEETIFQSESSRQHLDTTPTSRHASADENNSQNEHRRTQTSSHKSEGLSTGSSRRSQNRRDSVLSIESPHRPEGPSVESSRKSQNRGDPALYTEPFHRSEGPSTESSRKAQIRRDSALSAVSPHRSEGPSEKSSRKSQIRRNSAQPTESPHRSEGPSLGPSRKSQNRKESLLYAEVPKISGRRGVSTGGRRQQSSLTSSIAPANVEHNASLQSIRTETSSLSPITESLTTVQVVDETKISSPVSNTTDELTQLGLKRALQGTDSPEPVSIKSGKLLEMRRKDDSGRSGRKFNSSQTGDSRKRNGDNNSVSDSVSSANTRHHNRRPSSYISKHPEVSSSTFSLSDSFPADIPRKGFTSRTTTADFTPREGEIRATSISASHQNVAEVGARVNEPRSRGQFRNRSRELAGTERSMETRQQRTYHRSSFRSDGSRNKLSVDAVTNGKPQTTARNQDGETLSRSSDVTQKPLKGRGGSRWSHSRVQEHEILKPFPSWERTEDTPQSQSSAQKEVKKLQKQEMLKIMRDTETEDTPVDGSTDLEESFITRSSQQVVTVSVQPYSKDQSSASINHKSSGKTNAGVYSTVNTKAVFSMANVTADINKLKPRTAHLLLAPTPPPKSTDGNVEEIKVRTTEVIGGYSQLQGSKFGKTEIKDSKNEGNNVITTLPPFTRYSSRKCAVMTDENNFNKLPSTTPRGKSCERTYQETSAVPATEIQQVLTSTSAPSAPNSAISYASRSELKHRLASMRENLFPSAVSAATKPQPQSSSVPTVNKLLDGHVPTLDIGKGGNSRTNKALKDSAPRSTSSFRRSVELTRGDNWIVPAPNSVSVVTSQSFVANIPRLSSRYRSELLRATGHGPRGSTNPVYVPTVPTVSTTSTTSTTEQTMFSDKPPDALNLLDVTELSTPSIWKHTITPQRVHPTSPPSKSSTLTSIFHTSEEALESKISVNNIKSSVLSVSVQQSITGNASLKRLDNGSTPIAQQSNLPSNNYSSPDIRNLQRNLNNSEINSVLSTKISPNRDILSVEDTIENAETRDTSDVPKNSETTFKSRQNILTNSLLITPLNTRDMPKEMASPTLLPNLKFGINTMSNQSAETKVNPKPTETGASAATVTSVLSKENNLHTHKHRTLTAIPLQKKSLGNNLLSNFYDVIFPSSAESPPGYTIKATTPTPTVTDNTSVRFAMRLTPAPKGTMSSTTSRIVRVREIKGIPEPSVTPVSTVTDSYIQRIPPGAIHQSNVQAQAATEVPTITTTTDLPFKNNELTINNVLTLDIPTTTLETLSLQTTTLSTTNIQTTTLPSFDLPNLTELLTVAQISTIPTTAVPTTTDIPTTTVPTTTNIPTTTYPITTFIATSTTIHTTTDPVTTTTPTSTDIQTITVPITTNIPTTTANQTTTVLTTTTIPTPTIATPSTAPPHVTTPSIITLQAVDSNIQPLSVTQTTTAATPRVFTTTLRTPVPYVIFGIYPNGTVFRKIPNSDFKEQVHENEIARHNPFYPDHRYFSTTPPAPAQFVGSNEVAPLAPSFDDGFNSGRNEIQDEDAQVQQLPSVRAASPQSYYDSKQVCMCQTSAFSSNSEFEMMTDICSQRPQQPSGPTEAPARTSGFILGNLISNALGIDPQRGFLPSTRAEFLASIVRNSNIITANTTATTPITTPTTTTTNMATATTKPAPQPTVPSTSAAPKTTVNPAAGVLDDFSFLNVLLMGRPPGASPQPGRDQGSSIANRIIQVALSRGTSSSKKPVTPTPKLTTPKPTTAEATTLNTTTAAPKQSTVKQNEEDVAGLLKLLGSMEYTTPGNLTPSEQLLADFLAKQATSRPSQRNLSNQIRIQDILSPPIKEKRAQNLKLASTTTAAPNQLLGELFGPLLGANQGDNRIRDPRAGQGLVETAISATKAVSQLMGSVFEGASKSLQSFVKALAWGSGEASG